TLSVTVQRSYGNLGTLESTGVPMSRTAVSNLDYVAQSVRLQTGVGPYPYLPVQIIDNTIPQSDRILDMRLTDPWAGTILGGERILMGGALGVDYATVTIGDNDALHGVFNFAQVAYATNETARYAFVTVIRTNGLGGSCTVDYYTQDGTAKNGVNYLSTRGTLSFGSDESTRTFAIQVLHNPLVEFDKTVVLVLTNATGGAALSGGTPTSFVTSTLTIYDADFAAGHVNFSSIAFTNSELDGYGAVTVLRTGGSVGAIMAQFNTLDGTATNGVDYTAASTNLYWADGDTTPRVVSVPLTLLNVVKGTRTVRLRLSNPSVAGLLGALTNSTLYILEPNSYGNLAFSQPLYVADENGWSIQITVVRTDGAGGTVSVTAGTVAGGTAVPVTHYIPVTTNLVFAPGVLAQYFTIQIIDNNLNDGDRTIKMGLSAPVSAGLGPLNTCLLQIIDDESTHLPAGSLDATFNQDAQTDDAVYALALQADGRLLIAGDFVSVNAVTRKHLARLLPTGLLDPTFNADAGPNGPIRTMVLQSDNKILLGGSFTVVNGTNRNTDLAAAVGYDF
ncbi:MAG: Calx-beta domain-containing protein, partial [bacterium]